MFRAEFSWAKLSTKFGSGKPCNVIIYEAAIEGRRAFQVWKQTKDTSFNMSSIQQISAQRDSLKAEINSAQPNLAKCAQMLTQLKVFFGST